MLHKRYNQITENEMEVDRTKIQKGTMAQYLEIFSTGTSLIELLFFLQDKQQGREIVVKSNVESNMTLHLPSFDCGCTSKVPRLCGLSA